MSFSADALEDVVAVSVAAAVAASGTVGTSVEATAPLGSEADVSGSSLNDSRACKAATRRCRRGVQVSASDCCGATLEAVLTATVATAVCIAALPLPVGGPAMPDMPFPCPSTCERRDTAGQATVSWAALPVDVKETATPARAVSDWGGCSESEDAAKLHGLEQGLLLSLYAVNISAETGPWGANAAVPLATPVAVVAATAAETHLSVVQGVWVACRENIGLLLLLLQASTAAWWCSMLLLPLLSASQQLWGSPAAPAGSCDTLGLSCLDDTSDAAARLCKCRCVSYRIAKSGSEEVLGSRSAATIPSRPQKPQT